MPSTSSRSTAPSCGSSTATAIRGAIVKALIDLAGALEVEVTAEGVETEAQKALLVAMGCQQLQGYLLSPPLEPAQLLALARPVVGERNDRPAAASA